MQRDKLQEESGFYKKYDNTIEIDVTNCKNAEEGANILLTYIKQNIKLCCKIKVEENTIGK